MKVARKSWRMAAQGFADVETGTEATGPLLQSLVAMRRSRRVLEIGAGFTTFFLAAALRRVAKDAARDRRVCGLAAAADQLPPYPLSGDVRPDAEPHLHVIDNGEQLDLCWLQDELELTGLAPFVSLHRRHYQGLGTVWGRDGRTFDFIWFDCGGPDDYASFLNEYWPLVDPVSGLVALHFTEVELAIETSDGQVRKRLSSPVLNALRRTQALQGLSPSFECLTIVEPHKRAQGSVTLIQKLSGTSSIRDAEYEHDFSAFYGFPASSPLTRIG